MQNKRSEITYRRKGKERNAMSEEYMDNNRVYVAGRIVSGFRYSHEMYGEKFYNADILVCRSSGFTDTIPLMASGKLVDVRRDYSGCMVEASGQFRSYNKHDEEKRRLVLSVFVQELFFPEEEDVDYGGNNRIELEGYICKVPVYRKTPLGREIADMLLAVNRPYGKSDYIPCIVWGRNAKMAARLEVGGKVRVSGRIQSREYIKMLSETESEVRMAYEVSACSLEIEMDRQEAGA